MTNPFNLAQQDCLTRCGFAYQPTSGFYYLDIGECQFVVVIESEGRMLMGNSITESLAIASSQDSVQAYVDGINTPTL